LGDRNHLLGKDLVATVGERSLDRRLQTLRRFGQLGRGKAQRPRQQDKC
jgi:hypothetical protein